MLKIIGHYKPAMLTYFLDLVWQSSLLFTYYDQRRCFPSGSDGKVSVCNVGYPGSISGSGIFSEGNGNPLQDSCLENSMDRGAW